MPTAPLGIANPSLLAQCGEWPVPLDADTLPIHVTIWGEGSRVLMVHGGVQGGIGGGPVNFAGQKALADMGWQIELLDRPGFGGSASRGPDNMEKDAILIAGLLGEGVHLVGHSFGGAEVLLAAARKPAAVRSLIMIEPALQPLLFVDPDPAAAAAAKTAASVVGEYITTAKTPAEFALMFAKSMGRAEDGGTNRSMENLAGDQEKFAFLGRSLLMSHGVSPQDMLAAAHSVRDAGIPTLVISSGYHDGQEATAAGVARATGGRHVVVPCGSHFTQQANPGEFNRVIDEFMLNSDAFRN